MLFMDAIIDKMKKKKYHTVGTVPKYNKQNRQ